MSTAEIVELGAQLSGAALIEADKTIPVSVRDPKDKRMLAAAIEGAADYLVTGDQDLLVLQGDPRLGDLRIVPAARFLATLEDSAAAPENARG
jgi:predicted nucleic acid-binding protein